MRPRQVAVIGASERTASIGNALMVNLLHGGFPGRIFPVNPKHRNVYGFPAYRSVAELDSGIDLAIIATPIDTVPKIIEACVERKIGGAIVISAGGKEVGEAGTEIEKKINALVRATGFRIIGPNCLGMLRPKERLNASFVSGMPPVGSLAFVSQSGAICSALLDLAFKERIGFSGFVSIGSMVDVDFGDIINYFGNDSSVTSILLYIENVTNFRKFMSAARAVSRMKPIIVLKAGRSVAGAKAAASHTGAMVGEDAVYDAAFKRAGVVRVDTIEALFDCAELMARQPRPRGRRLAIITNGGGPGVMAADFLAGHGHELVSLLPETVKELDTILPSYWSKNNPIDILGDAPAKRFRQVLDICIHSRNFDAILVILAPQALADAMTVAGALVEAVKGARCPMFSCWMGGKSIEHAVEILNGCGIPTFATPERALLAFLYMVSFVGNQEMLLEVPPKLTRSMAIDHDEANRIKAEMPEEGFLVQSKVYGLLAAYGLPVINTMMAATEEAASRLCRDMGYPVVMKLCSPDITHKTDAGGVCLDLRTDADVRRAFRQIIASSHRYKPHARIEGVTIQPFLANGDFEILLGAKRDTDFGPVILFGLGGIFTEVLRDRALALPPMNRLLARRMMQETKAYTLLQGYRNRPPADFEQLEEMIVRLSQLLIDFPQLAELDMNPVMIKDGRPLIVDARLLLSPSTVASPLHLVISPYPGENEYHLVTENGVSLFIRPVRPEDAPLFVNLFKELSPTSIYYRFFGVMKELTREMLASFTQIDYDREIALVAIDEEAESERILGVARIIGDADGREGEFAVLVSDAWQGKGIGSALLKKCLVIAQERGLERVHGLVLQENKNMLALAEKAGFSIDRGGEAGEYRLRIAFDRSARG
jgi:acetyltransferase